MKIINTVTELDALPVRTIVMDAHERGSQKFSNGWGPTGLSTTYTEVALPVTVLYEPGKEPEPFPFAKEAHLIHIRGLEATLTRRNEWIEELETRLSTRAVENTALNRAYKDGWKDCAAKMMDITHKAALDLRELRADAFELYLEGDRK